MRVYLNGKVISTSNFGIVFEHNNEGMFINMLGTEELELFKFTKIFLYDYFINNFKYIYGFKTLGERTMFLELLKVNKVGPKIAQSITSKITHSDFKDLIKNKDVEEIRERLDVSEKISLNLLSDLSKKYSNTNIIKKIDTDKNDSVEIETKNDDSESLENIEKALIKIGYKKEQISNAIGKIEIEPNNFEVNVKNAIKMISAKHEQINEISTS